MKLNIKTTMSIIIIAVSSISFAQAEQHRAMTANAIIARVSDASIGNVLLIAQNTIAHNAILIKDTTAISNTTELTDV